MIGGGDSGRAVRIARALVEELTRDKGLTVVVDEYSQEEYSASLHQTLDDIMRQEQRDIGNLRITMAPKVLDIPAEALQHQSGYDRARPKQPFYAKLKGEHKKRMKW